MGIEKVKRKGRVHYRGRKRWHGKTYRTPTFPTRELAEEALKELAAAWRVGALESEFGQVARVRRKFGEVADTYLETRELETLAGERSPTTMSRERITVRRLGDHFGRARLIRDLAAGDVNGWIFDRRKSGAKGATINRELSSLRGILREAQKRGWVDRNVALEVDRCKEAASGWRWLTPEQAKRLVEACDKAPEQGRHLRPLVITALYTGMRRGELLSLRWENVHLGRAELEVIASKSGYRRTVPLRSEVVNALRKWRRKSRGEFVFARGSGAPFSKIRRSFQSAVARAKLGSLRFHDLRHTAASWMAQEGADVYEMARVLGHRDIASTMRYSHLIPRSSRRAVERMPSLEDTSVLDFPGEKSG